MNFPHSDGQFVINDSENSCILNFICNITKVYNEEFVDIGFWNNNRGTTHQVLYIYMCVCGYIYESARKSRAVVVNAVAQFKIQRTARKMHVLKPKVTKAITRNAVLKLRKAFYFHFHEIKHPPCTGAALLIVRVTTESHGIYHVKVLIFTKWGIECKVGSYS
jgi:hypothetical protein